MHTREVPQQTEQNRPPHRSRGSPKDVALPEPAHMSGPSEDKTEATAVAEAFPKTSLSQDLLNRAGPQPMKQNQPPLQRQFKDCFAKTCTLKRVRSKRHRTNSSCRGSSNTWLWKDLHTKEGPQQTEQNRPLLEGQSEWIAKTCTLSGKGRQETPSRDLPSTGISSCGKWGGKRFIRVSWLVPEHKVAWRAYTPSVVFRESHVRDQISFPLLQ